MVTATPLLATAVLIIHLIGRQRRLMRLLADGDGAQAE
jgi:hypothetical protein